MRSDCKGEKITIRDRMCEMIVFYLCNLTFHL